MKNNFLIIKTWLNNLILKNIYLVFIKNVNSQIKKMINKIILIKSYNNQIRKMIKNKVFIKILNKINKT